LAHSGRQVGGFYTGNRPPVSPCKQSRVRLQKQDKGKRFDLPVSRGKDLRDANLRRALELCMHVRTMQGLLGILCMILRISRTLRWPFGAFDISIDARICSAAFCSADREDHARELAAQQQDFNENPFSDENLQIRWQ
jgi:hypothetical protein